MNHKNTRAPSQNLSLSKVSSSAIVLLLLREGKGCATGDNLVNGETPIAGLDIFPSEGLAGLKGREGTPPLLFRCCGAPAILPPSGGRRVGLGRIECAVCGGGSLFRVLLRAGRGGGIINCGTRWNSREEPLLLRLLALLPSCCTASPKGTLSISLSLSMVFNVLSISMSLSLSISISLSITLSRSLCALREGGKTAISISGNNSCSIVVFDSPTVKCVSSIAPPTSNKRRLRIRNCSIGDNMGSSSYISFSQDMVAIVVAIAPGLTWPNFEASGMGPMSQSPALNGITFAPLLPRVFLFFLWAAAAFFCAFFCAFAFALACLFLFFLFFFSRIFFFSCCKYKSYTSTLHMGHIRLICNHASTHSA